MPTVKSDFVAVKQGLGPPTITGISNISEVHGFFDPYDPETGFVPCGAVPGTPYAVVSNGYNLYTILDITIDGVFIETGLNPDDIYDNWGEGNAVKLAYTYNSSTVVNVYTDSLVFTGTNLYTPIYGSWFDPSGHMFGFPPWGGLLETVASNADGTTLVTTLRSFGQWPGPMVPTAVLDAPAPVLVASDSTDANLNIKTEFLATSINDTSGVNTWTTIGAPTISALQAMPAPFINAPMYYHASGFSSDACYQSDGSDNWTFESLNGDQYLIQFLIEVPTLTGGPYVLFNIGLAGYDGFRIQQNGDQMQLVFMAADSTWTEPFTEETISITIPAANTPFVLNVVRTDGDEVDGAIWRMSINDGTWTGAIPKSWDPTWWGWYLYCFIGAYQSTPPLWDEFTDYTTHLRVIYDGVPYYSLQEPNIGNVPTLGGDAFWAQDAEFLPWNGKFWSMRWVNGVDAPYTQTLLQDEYTTFISAQPAAGVETFYAYPGFMTYSIDEYNSSINTLTYDPGTGNITLGGDSTFVEVPKYVVGTSGTFYTVTDAPSNKIITIDPSLALDEVYSYYTNGDPYWTVVCLSPTRGDAGSTVISNIPVSLIPSDSEMARLQDTSNVDIEPITQTLPPIVPTVANGWLWNWQTGIGHYPQVLNPTNTAAGPGISQNCNPNPGGAWPYHGVDWANYGIWDCNGWAPPAEESSAPLLSPGTLYHIRGGVFVHGMAIAMGGWGRGYDPIYWNEYTGTGNPGPGEWKYIDSQNITLRAPSSYPIWCTSLWDGIDGVRAPNTRTTYPSTQYLATVLFYGSGSSLVYWVYDTENGYAPMGTRALVISAGYTTGASLSVFCTSSVSGAI
jgi:hypothetical protein